MRALVGKRHGQSRQIRKASASPGMLCSAGTLQEGLKRRFGNGVTASRSRFAVAGTLFGLAHTADGFGQVLLAGLVGVDYGVAWRQAPAPIHRLEEPRLPNLILGVRI